MGGRYICRELTYKVHTETVHAKISIHKINDSCKKRNLRWSVVKGVAQLRKGDVKFTFNIK